MIRAFDCISRAGLGWLWPKTALVERTVQVKKRCRPGNVWAGVSGNSETATHRRSLGKSKMHRFKHFGAMGCGTCGHMC